MGILRIDCRLVQCDRRKAIRVQVEPLSCNNYAVNVSFQWPALLGEPNEFPCKPNSNRPPANLTRIADTNRYFYIVPYDGSSSYKTCLSGTKCHYNVCNIHFTRDIYSNCSNNSFAVDPNSDSPVPSVNYITPALICTFFLVLLIFLCIGLWMNKEMFINIRRNYFPRDFTLDLLIVYVDEHPKHRDVILNFATFLNKEYGIRVHLDLYDKQKIYINPTNWLQEKLSLCEKILIVWSPSAGKLWEEHERKTKRQDMFTPVLKHLKNDLILSKHLEKYIYAYFKFFEEKVVPNEFRTKQIPCFKLMDEFTSLYSSLSSLNTSTCLKLTQSNAPPSFPDLESSNFDLPSHALSYSF